MPYLIDGDCVYLIGFYINPEDYQDTRIVNKCFEITPIALNSSVKNLLMVFSDEFLDKIYF